MALFSIPRFDPSRVAIVDSSATTIQTQPLTAPSGAGHAHVQPSQPRATDPTTFRSRPAAPAGSALVVSENYFPGWSATADGKSVPVARMNFNLIGARFPPEREAVHFEFEDAAYEKGKVADADRVGAGSCRLDCRVGRRDRGGARRLHLPRDAAGHATLEDHFQ